MLADERIQHPVLHTSRRQGELAAAAPRLERDLARSCLGLIDSLSSIRLLLAIPRGLEAPELLAQATRVLLRSHEVTRCSVFVLKAGLLECAAGASLGDTGAGRGDETGPIGQTTVFRLGEGLMGHAALERATVCVGDVRKDARFLPVPSSPRPPRALVSVPLLAGPRVLGVLNVSHPDVHNWSGWQQQVFELYGQIIAERLHYDGGPERKPPS
jgi:GAF domain-containing protein